MRHISDARSLCFRGSFADYGHVSQTLSRKEKGALLDKSKLAGTLRSNRGNCSTLSVRIQEAYYNHRLSASSWILTLSHFLQFRHWQMISSTHMRPRGSRSMKWCTGWTPLAWIPMYSLRMRPHVILYFQHSWHVEFRQLIGSLWLRNRDSALCWMLSPQPLRSRHVT